MLYTILYICLTFLAPSGPPVNFTASINDTILSLAWNLPEESDQNGEIISYNLTCSTDEKDIEIILIADVKEIDLGVYEYGTNYSCSIYASTPVGGGPPASLSIVTGSKCL